MVFSMRFASIKKYNNSGAGVFLRRFCLCFCFLQMDEHDSCYEDKGHQTDDAGRDGSDEGIAAVEGKIHADGGDAVDGTVGHNSGDAAFGL